MFYKSISLIVFSFVISGCNILPYESEFGCRLEDNYGKCASMEEAYKEAVTGEPQGELIVPASQKGNSTSKNEAQKSSNGSDNSPVVPAEQPYPNYRDSVYKELSTLIQHPQTPMLRAPETIRTLVLSYSPGTRKQVLYMPRFIFSVIEEPEWVLGQYLHKKPELVEGIVDSGSIEK
ncbi:TraV family lipoprotein [Endozoicomonas sp. ONNA1]|uniref:TraV family lipoprotein n=1 Tax=Endozoicomonas sp. ONNA1 TaxID=2828740 RepID=UPI002147365E|nr:TraV family lipoprotein [Endozoicomonas sp. ONNA1]